MRLGAAESLFTSELALREGEFPWRRLSKKTVLPSDYRYLLTVTQVFNSKLSPYSAPSILYSTFSFLNPWSFVAITLNISWPKLSSQMTWNLSLFPSLNWDFVSCFLCGQAPPHDPALFPHPWRWKKLKLCWFTQFGWRGWFKSSSTCQRKPNQPKLGVFSMELN